MHFQQGECTSWAFSVIVKTLCLALERRQWAAGGDLLLEWFMAEAPRQKMLSSLFKFLRRGQLSGTLPRPRETGDSSAQSRGETRGHVEPGVATIGLGLLAQNTSYIMLSQCYKWPATLFVLWPVDFKPTFCWSTLMNVLYIFQRQIK